MLLSRPGTYIAIARDDATQEVVATTGAVFSAGDELRPTGSDVGALMELATRTGGVRRDHLADAFEQGPTTAVDPMRRRNGYVDPTSWLLAAAAVSILSGAGTRRLAWPARQRAVKREMPSREEAMVEVVRPPASSEKLETIETSSPPTSAPDPLDPLEANPKADEAASGREGTREDRHSVLEILLSRRRRRR